MTYAKHDFLSDFCILLKMAHFKKCKKELKKRVIA
jgi:hypothetical protein